MVNAVGSEYLQNLLNCSFLDYIDKSTSLSIEGLELYFTNWKCRIFYHNDKNCKSILLGQLENNCRYHKYTGAKIISMNSVAALFDLVKQGIKVIHLVRDPRSKWLSRAKITAAHDKNTSLDDYLTHIQKGVKDDPALLNAGCISLEKDLTLLEDLHDNAHSSHYDHISAHMHKNYRIVRYEDVALEPVPWAKSMYEFLDIPFHTNVLKWIDANTKENQG